MSDDDDLLPKKKAPSVGKAAPAKGSPRVRRAARYVRAVGILAGGLVTLVAAMSLVGLVTDNLWVRLIVALVLVIGLPAALSDRLLKRMGGGGAARVADVFAICLLAIAIVLVAADFLSRPLFVHEGDRYARSGSRTMARVAYFLGGVSPVFVEGAAADAGSDAGTDSDAGATR